MAITSRFAEGLDDLSAAERLLSEAWLADGPRVAVTPGDLEWWFAQAHPLELPDLLRLWFEADALVAWSWHSAPSEIEWHLGPARNRVAVADAILSALPENRSSGRTAGSSGAWAADDDRDRVLALERHGFRAVDEQLTQWVRRVGDGRAIPAPELPPGYILRTVLGATDVSQRVEVHRLAFAPSRMTEAKYRRLMTLPHYRPEHDIVVVAPNDTLAGFTMAWWDPVGRVGELEPVGTHPHHRRRGLARATTLAALRLLADLGATWVQVFSEAANAASEALYASVGFEVHARHRRYVRD